MKIWHGVGACGQYIHHHRMITGGLAGAVWRGWRLRPSCPARRRQRRCQRQRYAPCRGPCAARRPTSPRPASCAPGERAVQRERECGTRASREQAEESEPRKQPDSRRISRRNKLAVIRAATAGQSVTTVLLLLITLKGLSPQGGRGLACRRPPLLVEKTGS